MPISLKRRQGPKAASGLKLQQVVTKGSLGSRRIGHPDSPNDFAADWFITGVLTDPLIEEFWGSALVAGRVMYPTGLSIPVGRGYIQLNILDAGLRALLGRLAIVGKVARGIDQCEMRKGLRKIADQATRMRLILLAQQT